MAGISNDEFQDTELEDFEYVKSGPKPNKLLKQYESLQCELELDFEVLTVAEVYTDGQFYKKKKQDKRLDEIEGSYWSDYAENIIGYTKNGGSYYILTQLLNYGLSRTKACESNRRLIASFLIVENCEISSINYKKLGHTPKMNTSWTEVNLALAEATALLCVLSDKIKVRFQKYFPVPHDSKSFIIDLSDQSILPLYGEGKFCHFKIKDFDDALVAFLNCLSQLNAEIKKTKPGDNIPHEIKKDKLKDPISGKQYTVKLRKSTNLNYWSRALRYLLNNMKYLSQWVYRKEFEQTESSHIEELLEECNNRFDEDLLLYDN